MERFGRFILNLSDDQIEYQILEEYSTEFTAFLSEYTRNQLLDNGLTDDEINQLSKELQSKLLWIYGTDMWNVESLRSELIWKEAMLLCDHIKGLIHQKWTDEEIKMLRETKW